MAMGLPYRDDPTKPIPLSETNGDGDADLRCCGGNPEGGGNGDSPNEGKESVLVPDNCRFFATNKRDRVCYGHPSLCCTLDRDTDMVC